MRRSCVVNLYEDPGHGWAKVKRAKLQELGIADKISSYSYQRGDYVYLEEDCDLSLFDAAMKASGVEKINYKYFYADKRSKIRSYEHYHQ